MSDEDDYTEALGTAESEPAAEPLHAAPKVQSFDEDLDEAPRRVRIPQTDATRKAMADTIAAFKADKLAHPEDADDEGFGPTDEPAALEPGETRKPVAKSVDAAPAVEKPSEPIAKPAEAPVSLDQKLGEAPPAPSLDPEVSWLRKTLSEQTQTHQKQMAEDRAALVKEREAFEARRESASKAVDYETYLESAPKSYRTWLEEMRGDKMSDDEYRQEAADFVTLMSSDVLGVKLPDDVLARIQTQQVRKSLSAYKAKDSRQKMAETNARETAEVEAKWKSSAASVDAHFLSDEPTRKQFRYLAAEESPGSIIVDVIKSALAKDGTRMSWNDASKLADDYLSKQAKAYYEKRKHLLVEQPAAKAVETEAPTGRPSGTQVVRAPAPTPPAPATQPPVIAALPPKTGKWSNEEHRRATRRAFAPVFNPKP